MRVRKNIFWGLAFILAAVALVVKKLGYLQGVGVWSILFSVILAVIFVKGIMKRRWATILFSAAFFIIVNDELLRLESLTPWTVLGVAFLGTIGLNMIFPRGTLWHHRRRPKGLPKHIANKITRDVGSAVVTSSNGNEMEWNEADEAMVSEDGETIQQDVIFGEQVKYVKSQQLSHINADCIFGEISIYLTEAALKNHRAHMSSDAIFGTINVYVPASWSVDTNVDTIFGEVFFRGNGEHNGEDKLLISGDMIFGELWIYYV